jgi:hypothetical protein
MNSLYMTGFIPRSDTPLRIKQGLLPQDISNVCAPLGLACNHYNMNPAGVVQIP